MFVMFVGQPYREMDKSATSTPIPCKRIHKRVPLTSRNVYFRVQSELFSLPIQNNGNVASNAFTGTVGLRPSNSCAPDFWIWVCLCYIMSTLQIVHSHSMSTLVHDMLYPKYPKYYAREYFLTTYQCLTSIFPILHSKTMPARAFLRCIFGGPPHFLRSPFPTFIISSPSIFSHNLPMLNLHFSNA